MKYMPASRIPRFILLLICELDISIWPYQRNLDQNQHLSLPMVNGNLKDATFGLAQATAYFQRLVNEVLSGLTFAFGYLDDILILVQIWKHI